DLRRDLIAHIYLRGFEAEHIVFGAVARRAGDCLLVFAGKAVHGVHAAVSRTRDGRCAGWRMDCGGRWARRGAAAAPAGHRVVGRRLRHSVRLSGPRVRSPCGTVLNTNAVWRHPVDLVIAAHARGDNHRDVCAGTRGESAWSVPGRRWRGRDLARLRTVA